jgi:periplasmic divalent cation tolerance protein
MLDQLAPRIVLLTAPNSEVAERLASSLVAARLAACVSRVPGLISTYRWEGEVKEDSEFLLLIKTTNGQLTALEAAVNAQHPYEVPELIALEPSSVSAPYLSWLQAAVAEVEKA